MCCYKQGFWYFTEKKQNFAGFSGANSQKNQLISREKIQNSRKNQPISRDWKKVKFRRIFRSKFLEKSADLTGNFGGKLRQEIISKKQPISLDFFRQISLKSINFASIWPALFNVFLTGIIICSFNNSSLGKWANAKAIDIMVSAQFFATLI